MSGALPVLNTSVVLEQELDGLGHMNSRFYTERANRGHRALLEQLGLGRAECARIGRRMRAVDSYVRFHREQFAGAPLRVEGGVLDADEDGAAFFYDVRNAEKNETAATIIMRCALVDDARVARKFPEDFVARAKDFRVAAPPYGLPRTLDLAPPRLDMRYQDIVARLGDQKRANYVNQRRERVIDASECDEAGYVRTEQDVMFDVRAAAAKDSGAPAFRGPTPIPIEDGRRIGWALLENRIIQFTPPRAGDLIESIGAELDIQAKTRKTRRWAFNKSTGAFISIIDTVTIALDLDRRRTIEIPEGLREALHASHAPEFA